MLKLWDDPSILKDCGGLKLSAPQLLGLQSLGISRCQTPRERLMGMRCIRNWPTCLLSKPTRNSRS